MSARSIAAATLFLVCLVALPAMAADPLILEVDTSKLNRHLMTSKITIPVEPGEQAFWYPKWIPGIHGPGEQIRNMGGLKITSSAGRLDWMRDPNELYRFLVQVPEGVDSIVAELTYIESADARFTRRGQLWQQQSIWD